MDAIFADTFFFLALLNERDNAHEKALNFETTTRPLVTTAWVLTEVGDALASPANRPVFLKLLETLNSSPDARIIGPTQELFDCGVELFRLRPDKDWSLTDCISFEAMRAEKIADALTGDHHFEQAGFRVLLR